MNLKTFGWLIAIFGQMLIALCFFVLFNLTAMLGTEICWLDFIVVSLIFWLWIFETTRHPINLNDPSGKQAAGLGMRWNCLIFYTLIAGGGAVAFIVAAFNGSPVAFKWQLLAQLIILFIAAVWLFISSSATAFAGKVYGEEQQKMSGKVNLRSTLSKLAESAATAHGLPSDINSRICRLRDDVRYISPSASEEAQELDRMIEGEATTIRYSLSDYKLNRDQISATLSNLERHFSQRKQTY